MTSMSRSSVGDVVAPSAETKFSAILKFWKKNLKGF